MLFRNVMISFMLCAVFAVANVVVTPQVSDVEEVSVILKKMRIAKNRPGLDVNVRFVV